MWVNIDISDLKISYPLLHGNRSDSGRRGQEVGSIPTVHYPHFFQPPLAPLPLPQPFLRRVHKGPAACRNTLRPHALPETFLTAPGHHKGRTEPRKRDEQKRPRPGPR